MGSRLTQPSGGDAGVKEQPQVPPTWRLCDVEKIQSVCNLFDHPPCTGTIDCVEFLLHIGLLHSPLGWPSVDTLLQVRKFLEPFAPQGASWPDFWVTADELAQTPLFLDSAGKET